MKTIKTETSRFPNPEKSLPNLAISIWCKKRLEELQKATQTDSVKTTMSRLQKVIAGETIVEPPAIVDEENVSICIISRAARTLWFDELVKRITFDEFLTTAFPNGIPKSTIAKATPFSLAELEEIVRSNVSVPVPGYIDVIDSDGEVKKVIIADVLDEKTIHREDFFGEYIFEEIATDIFGFDGDTTPAYPFNTLKDLSLAITTIKDRFFKTSPVIHSISLNLLRSLITEYDKPGKVISAVVGGDNTINETTVPADITITNELMVKVDKTASKDDIQIVSLTDDNGVVLNPSDYTVRVLPDHDPLTFKVEVVLLNYHRKFFAPDTIGKSFGFSLALKTEQNEKPVTVKLTQTWVNPGNLYNLNVIDFDKSFSDINNFPLTGSLTARGETTPVKDLTPLVFIANETFDDRYGVPPTIVDDKYTTGVSGEAGTITFNLKQTGFGELNLSFTDKRIIPSRYLIADKDNDLTANFKDSYYDEEKQQLVFKQRLGTSFDDKLDSLTKVIYDYKEVNVSVEGGDPIKGTITLGEEPSGKVATITVPWTGKTSNLSCSIEGTVVIGLNKVSESYTGSFLLNLVLIQLVSANAPEKLTAIVDIGDSLSINGTDLTINVPATELGITVESVKENGIDISTKDLVCVGTLTMNGTDNLHANVDYIIRNYQVAAFAPAATVTKEFEIESRITGRYVDEEKSSYTGKTVVDITLPLHRIPVSNRATKGDGKNVTITFGIGDPTYTVTPLQPDVRADYNDMFVDTSKMKLVSVGKAVDGRIPMTFEPFATGRIYLEFKDPRIGSIFADVANPDSGWQTLGERTGLEKAVEGSVTYNIYPIDKEYVTISPDMPITAVFNKDDFLFGDTKATEVTATKFNGDAPGFTIVAKGNTSLDNTTVSFKGKFLLGENEIVISYQNSEEINHVDPVTPDPTPTDPTPTPTDPTPTDPVDPNTGGSTGGSTGGDTGSTGGVTNTGGETGSGGETNVPPTVDPNEGTGGNSGSGSTGGDTTGNGDGSGNSNTGNENTGGDTGTTTPEEPTPTPTPDTPPTEEEMKAALLDPTEGGKYAAPGEPMSGALTEPRTLITESATAEAAYMGYTILSADKILVEKINETA